MQPKATRLSLLQIPSPAEALELVRYFSSPYSWHLFQGSAFLEVSWAALEGSWLGHLRASLVQRGIDVSIGIQEDARHGPGALAELRFQLERTVLALDGNVYRIRESVTESGLYALEGQERLASNVLALGP